MKFKVSLITIGIFVFFIGIAFSYGFLVGAFGLPPQKTLVYVKNLLLPGISISEYARSTQRSVSDNYDDDFQVYLQSNFQHPIIKTVPQLYGKVQNIGDIAKIAINQGLKDYPHQTFFGAYNKIKLRSVEKGHTENTVKLGFEINNFNLMSHAYLIPAQVPGNDCAILFMPGTGHNMSTELLLGGHEYYGMAALNASAMCDVYIYVRPLEDYRSIHNGENKIHEIWMYGDSILNGSSHASVYLTEALALAKAIKAKYGRFGLMGLSLGGHATFLLSLEAEPSFAVVASGWSNSFLTYSTAGINQILIPGLYQYYNESRIRDKLLRTGTKYLFTYGAREFGVYGYEAKTNSTCKFLKTLATDKFDCHVHSGGHVFADNYTEAFYKRVLTANH